MKENRKICLFINSSSVLHKLLSGKKFSKSFKSIEFEKFPDKTISEVVKRLGVSIIVLGIEKSHRFSHKEVDELTELRLKKLRIFEAETFYELVNERIPIINLEGQEYLADDIFSIKMRRRYLILKRLFDLLFVFLLLPVALPLVLFACLLTVITSKGGAFFSQIRVGKGGKDFKIYKIRTMVQNSGGFTVAGDSRITRIGKFLRLTKIDELPQLYNILVGEMSVIGPRPEQPKYVEEFAQNNPFYNLRHMIKPGVSGWAQIHLPKATPEDTLKKMEYDLFYIKRYSWKLDIRILIQTVKIVLTLNSH